MPQIRLFLTAGEREAARMLDRLGNLFEDEGLAVATTEVDEKAGLWEVSVYSDGAETDTLRKRMRDAISEEFGSIRIEEEELPDIDWVTKSLEGLKPVRAGRFLVHGGHDSDKVRASDIPVLIEAGRAFGTGHHGTTAGCLEMIETVVRRERPRNALDLGTGSGVLAIALAKTMPGAILATDIDPIATEVALSNARLNGVGQRIVFRTAAGFHSTAIATRAPFDLIVANILARPLMRMAPQIAANLAAGGTVVLSGILAEQRWKVLSAFNAQGLAHRETLWREGWVTLRLS